MPITLGTLSGTFAKTSVSFMGQTAKIMYDPLLLTQENVTKSQSGSDEDFIAFFTQVVKSWDVQSSPTKKIPLTAAGLKTVPLPLLKAIYAGIVYGEADEVAEQGKASSDG